MIAVSPTKVLEDLQKKQFEQFGVDPDEYRSLELLEMRKVISAFVVTDYVNKFLNEDQKLIRHIGYNNQLKFYEESIKKCPKYEKLSWYVIMQELLNYIKTANPDLWTKRKKLPIFGSLATGDVNAKTMAVQNNTQKIVIFEDEIFHLCNILCKIFANCFPYKMIDRNDRKLVSFTKDLEEIKLHIHKHKEITRLFQDLIFSYLFKGAPGYAETYNIIQPPNDQIWISLRLSMELFIFSHELAHIVLGHLGDFMVRPNMQIFQPIKEVRNFWKKEYSADEMGLIISNKTITKLEGIETEIPFFGANLFFRFNEIINKSIMIIRNGNESIIDNIQKKQSHPPPNERLNYLRKIMIENHKNLSIASTDMITDGIMNLLWKNIRNHLKLKHNQGIKLNERFDFYLV